MMTTVVLLLAVAVWFTFSVRYVLKRDAETALVVSSAALAAIWLLVAPQRANWSVATPGATVQMSATGLSRAPRSCVMVTLGMPAAEVKTTLGEPASIVSEADTQGPGADAWVYPNAGCVVHVLDGRARAVAFE